tara:strand:- start:10321 stop:10818 length:498 start_codon:yes stop_codon:yes gene_type:complete
MAGWTTLPKTLKATDPVAFIATWFGSGLLPKAPGTWGTIAALPPAYVIALTGGSYSLLLAAVFAFLIGTWSSEQYARACGKPDPSEVVIDEVAAIWLVLAFVPLSLIGWGVAFIVFRFFDIVKPWPVSLADTKLKGGFGIMFDDIIAAGYAILVIQFLQYLVEAF